ncbi:hypothetical protein GCM10011409_22980 [Lentibacillus populi]|uniref:Uncharacterized protein n=1 Tax=Lentibacillus populi TaxID=1827502 RepID=A0A9W5TYG2_9BACI|nr:hypothetical protein GCM10011409_22980 [Lentibacillus populi]
MRSHVGFLSAKKAYLYYYKSVFKKEDEKDREVRGGVVSSSGLAQEVLTSALPTGRGRFLAEDPYS